MSLPLDVTLLVLLAALMHASWNAIAKTATVTLLDITTMAVAAAALCAAALPFLPFPEPAAWPWLAASVLLHFLYFMALVGAYDHGDLSHAYPLMRGLAPLLVALFGIALLRRPFDRRDVGGCCADQRRRSAAVLHARRGVRHTRAGHAVRAG